MESVEELVRANRRAGVAEVCWSDAAGLPRATAVVPLEHEGRPALALHWSQWPSARELAACPAVAWVLSDRRLAQRDWAPGAGTGRMRLVIDHDGSVFGGSMLDQELRKHPPSRAFADSPVLRREHWWFLPRLVLVLEPVEVHPVAERTDPVTHGVLAVARDGGGIAVDTVSVAEDAVPAGSERMVCTSLVGRPAAASGRAVVLQHDFSVPDLERWGRRPVTGHWDGTGLAADGLVEGPLLPAVPGLRERVRRHRDLERQCRRALRDVSTS